MADSWPPKILHQRPFKIFKNSNIRFTKTEIAPQENKMDCYRFYRYGGFLKWGYPKMDGLYWETPLKWMITRGTPVLGDLHIA